MFMCLLYDKNGRWSKLKTSCSLHKFSTPVDLWGTMAALQLCVFGVLNIPGLYANHQNQMIANKFDISTDPIVYRYTKSTPVMLVSRKQRKKEDDFQNQVGTHQL